MWMWSDSSDEIAEMAETVSPETCSAETSMHDAIILRDIIDVAKLII